jgi:hypothetical protein
VTGTGNLDMSLLSQDEVKSVTITPLALQSTNEKQPTKLTNFVQQRALLKISTDEINEFFYIQRLILYVKQMYSQYPS